MVYRFCPIVTWPCALTRSRGRSKFSASYNDTLRLLDRELRHLGARNIVIQLALRPEEIRIDGLPRSGSRPSHPGVILSFDSKHGPLSYPCDRYADWESNLRAIALSLEHLRAVDRYGVTRRGEQYRGWTALPPVATAMTNDEAAAFLARMCGDGAHPDLFFRSEDAVKQAYRAAAFRLHPDRGGDVEEFKRLQDAKDALDRHWAAVKQAG